MIIESIAWHKLRTSRHSKVLPGRKIYCGEFLRKVLWAIDAPGATPHLRNRPRHDSPVNFILYPERLSDVRGMAFSDSISPAWEKGGR